MAKPKTERARPSRRSPRPTLSARHVNFDHKGLPGRAAALARALNIELVKYLQASHVSNDNFREQLSRALHHTLPKEGRKRRLSGTEYAVLAVHLRLKPIYERLEYWDEEPACRVLEALTERWRQMACAPAERFTLDLELVPSWLDAHRGEADSGDAVAHCIRLDAPDEVQIEKRLAQAGAQKRVFQANWTVADDPTEIVVKEFLGEAEQILIRERRPHPLSMTHPNIIETFTLDNDADPPQTFLVERRLDVLNDRRWLSGLAERARLLIDIARALAFLDHQGLVHGDVKPDNIGLRDGRFVLLDFGICRPAAEFIGEAAQTGSLRTRAPEILLGERHHSEKSDVWALGATMCNVLTGRFPLLDENETPPNPEHERKNARDSRRSSNGGSTETGTHALRRLSRSSTANSATSSSTCSVAIPTSARMQRRCFGEPSRTSSRLSAFRKGLVLPLGMSSTPSAATSHMTLSRSHSFQTDGVATSMRG